MHQQNKALSLSTLNAPIPLMEERAVAEYLGVKRKTVQNWRLVGGGPKFIRVGRSIRYRFEDIQAWLALREASSTSEYIDGKCTPGLGEQ